jgi:hypothetical protein
MSNNLLSTKLSFAHLYASGHAVASASQIDQLPALKIALQIATPLIIIIIFINVIRVIAAVAIGRPPSSYTKTTNNDPDEPATVEPKVRNRRGNRYFS